MKVGDVISQRRMPGGECLIISLFENLEIHKEDADGDATYWGVQDYPIVLILHPEEGLIEDPLYYYETIT